jgi:two-component system phosphate regulon sensor histidine kinase PhoR
MFHPRLLWRLYAGYVVIIVISTLIVGVLISRQVSENGTGEIHQSLSVQTELLAEIARKSFHQLSSSLSRDSLQQSIVKLGKITRSRMTIIDIDGTVLADSRELPENMDNHGDRPEIIDAREKGVSTTSRFSQTLQLQMVYRAQPVLDGENTLGYVRVSLPLTVIDNKLAQLRFIVLVSAGSAAFAALILGFFFARRLSAPLVNMTEVAEAISQGDYERRIEIGRRDEIGQLADAFNRMAISSAQRMGEITEDHSRLTKILSGMVEGVIGVDQNQKINHINQAAASLLELSPASSIGKPIWEIVRIEEIIQAMEQAIETGDVVETQMRRSKESGDLVVDIYVAALSNDDQESIGAVIVLHNISELDRLVKVRRDFVANASHELKTPITAIRGLTETILDDANMPAETRLSFIEKIHVQSLRLSSQVTDLMTISRLESGQNEQNFQAVNFSDTVRRSADAIRAICQEKNLKLELDLVDEDIIINGDKQGLDQLIDNLIDNAVKYTPADGTISVSLHKDLTTAKLIVKDTGIGISHQHQQRIFERFYRVDKARSRELGGTGLGLSIVKNITEQHGGSVSLQSPPGHGSSFTVLLPL